MNESILIFCDGACSGNPGPGGWGSILLSPQGKVIELGGSAVDTTNNRMEIMAATASLEFLLARKNLSSKKVLVFTDSKYLIQGITAWRHSWQKNQWKNAEGKEVANQDLWVRLAEICDGAHFILAWNYVPGHSGVASNDRVDEIAVAFSKGYSTKLFQGTVQEYSIDLQKDAARFLKGGAEKEKKIDPFYLSYVDGVLYRDRTWSQCESRVKGRRGVKFKKIERAGEEEKILEQWKVKL